MYDPATGWVTSTTDPSAQTTSYSYYGPTEANAGKIKCIANARGRKTWYDYTSRGELQHVWGHVPYPEERVYNDYGEMTELHTYQGGLGWSADNTWPGAGVQPQTTTWTYDAATGLLLSKTDALGRAYTNNYLFTRTLWTHTWARGVTITNTFNDYGEIIQKDYSDGTPSVIIHQYSMLGQPEYLTDALGSYRQIAYDFAGRPISTQWWPGMYVKNRYDPLYGRDQLVLEQDWTNALVQDYRFDATTGRMNLVSNGTMTVEYGYLPNSDLLQSTTFKNDGTNVMTTTRTWDYGFRLRSIGNVANGVTVSSHAYCYDSLNRRIRATLEDGSVWSYDYDDRNELTDARRYWPDWSPVAGQQFAYDYDNIGNRKTAKSGGDTNGCNLRQTGYEVNALNQYTTVTNLGYKDVIGVALTCGSVGVTNTITGAGGTADHKGEYFRRELAINNTTSLWQTVSVTCGGSVSNGGFAFPANRQALTYDADGNLTFDGVWTYEWDGENRLKAMCMTNIVSDSRRLRLDFGYDYQNRRIRKQVSIWDNGSSVFSPQYTNQFVYDGWNTIAIIDPQFAIKQSFTWGLDLSQSTSGAGGIGGLVFASFDSPEPGTYCVPFDGNGNVMALVSLAGGTSAARYDHSPFGVCLRSEGPLATANPFRFSTKFTDDETSLSYYGVRYYCSAIGRWLGHDPLGEMDCANLYLFARNSAVDTFDPTGSTAQQLAALGFLGGVASVADELLNLDSFTSFPKVRRFQGYDLQLYRSAMDATAAGLCIGIDLALGGRLLKNVGGRDAFAGCLLVGSGLGYLPKKGNLNAKFNRDQSLAGAVVSGRLGALSAIGKAAYAALNGSGPSSADPIGAAAFGFLQSARRGDTAWADLDAALLGAAIWSEQSDYFGRTDGRQNFAGLVFDFLGGDGAGMFSRLPNYQALNAWDMACEMEDLLEGM